MSDLAGLHSTEPLMEMQNDYPVGASIKRLTDLILALLAILLLLPILILSLSAIIITSRGAAPVFAHCRVGYRGRTFRCLKFRTMVPDAENKLAVYLAQHPEALEEWEQNRKLRHDPRVTRIGAVMRATSLDELPQLFNVLKGDMSLVGPRPVTEAELANYAHDVRHYLACRPGITGLWQISGRSSTTFAERVAFDTYYAQNWSLGFDTKILLMTLPVVLSSENAY